MNRTINQTSIPILNFLASTKYLLGIS